MIYKKDIHIGFISTIQKGAEVLDRELLPELLKLKYEAIEDAIAILGSGEVIAKTFTDFQKFLYMKRSNQFVTVKLRQLGTTQKRLGQNRFSL